VKTERGKIRDHIIAVGELTGTPFDLDTMREEIARVTF
jgi:hypothetical protein